MASEKAKPVTLMDMATIGAKVPAKSRACSQRWTSPRRSTPAPSTHRRWTMDGETEHWLLMFKNETHNHPTEIEPFGGAATCLGGAIRDPLSGRSYVYQAMRVTGCGDPPHARWTRHAAGQAAPAQADAPPRRRATPPTATRSAWPPGMVDEIYHAGYVAKRLEIGAVRGRAPRARTCAARRPRPGDMIILLGGAHGPRRLRRRNRLLQGAHARIRWTPAARRCKRAIPRRSASSSACSATRRSRA